VPSEARPRFPADRHLYRTKSALRDVGKVMGIDAEKIDRLASTGYGPDEKWIS